MKEKMSFDEMAEAYMASQSIYKPNRIRVGKFAKMMGYKLAYQKVNKKLTYFYVKDNG